MKPSEVGDGAASDRPFAVAAHGDSDVGQVRSTNEDDFGVYPKLGLFLVADGMGGAAAGEVASRMAVENVRRTVETGETSWPMDASTNGPESGPRRFISGIHRANRRIHALAAKDWKKRGMGTTVAAMLLLERTAVIAHVGDSRVYRMRDGELTLLTRDHSLANEFVDMGYLQPEQVATFTRKHVITRAVGTQDSVHVDTKIVDVRQGDTFLLCSDGLHGEVTDAEIGDVLRGIPSTQTTVDELIRLANRRGGLDNVTAVVVKLTAPVADHPSGTHEKV
jgi:protein phosphatase